MIRGLTKIVFSVERLNIVTHIKLTSLPFRANTRGKVAPNSSFGRTVNRYRPRSACNAWCIYGAVDETPAVFDADDSSPTLSSFRLRIATVNWITPENIRLLETRGNVICAAANSPILEGV